MPKKHLVAALIAVLCALPAMAQFYPQTPLPTPVLQGMQWQQPMATLSVISPAVGNIGPGGLETFVNDTVGNKLQLNICEFKSKILPAYPAGQNGTWTWGYVRGTACPDPNLPRESYLGPVLVATRDHPTEIKFSNKLPLTAGASNVIAYKNSVDQTLHWADPIGRNCMATQVMDGLNTNPLCLTAYDGPIPAVVHLHGGEVPPVLDGDPDQWYLSDASLNKFGSTYWTWVNSATPAAANEAVFRYPNTQEASPIWFHDHTLGATRLNVYAGTAGGYVVVDPNQKVPAELKEAAKIIPVILQDRMFDNQGQLFFPVGGDNPEHPIWLPEFFGDTIVINGKLWPYLNVEQKRYRFLFLNGSNARAYELNFPAGTRVWQIGTDGGYLDTAVLIDPVLSKVKHLRLLPGERAEVVIDFSRAAVGANLLITNTAFDMPYPGDPADPAACAFRVDPVTCTGGTGDILQFRVVASGAGLLPLTSFNPAVNPAIRLTGSKIVRLVNPALGKPVVTPKLTRQLTLNEVMGMGGAMANPITGGAFPGGPVEILVNNTKWSGLQHMMMGGTMMEMPRADFTPITVNGLTTYYSELPTEGDTELWEVVNLTADAHPIHLHLVQFQLMNRQPFDQATYEANAYGPAFPTGVFEPAFGPPLAINPSPASGNKWGGNPNVDPYLLPGVRLPGANETGWKDTVMMLPGEVTRIMVRWSPTHKAIADPDQSFPFATNAADRGYVWHCHIIDHEDNEMMRPDYIYPLVPESARAYKLGIDY